MKKTVYTLRPGASPLVFKGRRLLPGEWVDDPVLSHNSSCVPMVVDFPETPLKEELPTPAKQLLTEQLPVAYVAPKPAPIPAPVAPQIMVEQPPPVQAPVLNEVVKPAPRGKKR